MVACIWEKTQLKPDLCKWILSVSASPLECTMMTAPPSPTIFCPCFFPKETLMGGKKTLEDTRGTNS